MKLLNINAKHIKALKKVHTTCDMVYLIQLEISYKIIRKSIYIFSDIDALHYSFYNSNFNFEDDTPLKKPNL